MYADGWPGMKPYVPVARNVWAKLSPLSVNDARIAPRSCRSASEARQRGGEDEEEGGAARAHGIAKR